MKMAVDRRPGYRASDFLTGFGWSKRGLPNVRLPYKLCVFSHHKCGTVWLGRILLAIGQENGLSVDINHSIGASVSRQHDISLLTNAVHRSAMHFCGVEGLHVIRNPMSIVVSAYHSHYSSHPTDSWPELEQRRNMLREMSLVDGLWETLRFLEGYDGRENDLPLSAMIAWDYDDSRIKSVRLEDLTSNWPTVLGNLLDANRARGVKLPHEDQFTFEAMSGGRKIGNIDNQSHFRSGRFDGWREELPQSIQNHIRLKYRPFLQRFYPEAL